MVIVPIAIILCWKFFDLHFQKIEKAVTHNGNILEKLQDEYNKKQTDLRLKKLEKSVRALTNTQCAQCHVAQEHLLLPLRERIITFEKYQEIVRTGALEMPAFDATQMPEQTLRKQYSILYAK